MYRLCVDSPIHGHEQKDIETKEEALSYLIKEARASLGAQQADPKDVRRFTIEKL